MSQFSTQNHFPQEVDPALTLLEIYFGLGQKYWRLKPQLGHFLVLQMRKQAQRCWLIVCPALNTDSYVVESAKLPSRWDQKNAGISVSSTLVLQSSFRGRQFHLVNSSSDLPVFAIRHPSLQSDEFFSSLKLFLHICITLQFAKHFHALWCCVYYYIIIINMNYCNFYICYVLLFSQLCKS